MQRSFDVLVVEDDPLVLMNYIDILEEAGFHAIPAESMGQGRRELARRDFSLLICDHDLGDGKGITLISMLEEAERELPVIYLSAALSSVLKEIEKHNIVKLVLSKPVSPEQLLESVKDTVAASETNSDDDRYPELVGRDEREFLLDAFKNIK